MNRTLTIAHEGVTYHGRLVTIRSTRLGPEDHGIFTATLILDSGSSFGGYSLDEPFHGTNGRMVRRVGTGFGMDHVMQIMWAVGVDRWESLVGRQVVALSDHLAECREREATS
jgi:hypothetical protein